MLIPQLGLDTAGGFAQSAERPRGHHRVRTHLTRTLARIIHIYIARRPVSSSSVPPFLIAHPIPPNANETRRLRRNVTETRNRTVAHLHPTIRFPAAPPRAAHRPSPHPSLLRVWTKIRTRTVTMTSLTSTLQLTFQRYTPDRWVKRDLAWCVSPGNIH